jgi:cytochrome bd-type quinol oxidase subunit 2
MILNHFWAMTLFALAVSVAFAFLTKHTTVERLKYFLWAFLTFMIVAIGIGWLMYPFSH